VKAGAQFFFLKIMGSRVRGNDHLPLFQSFPLGRRGVLVAERILDVKHPNRHHDRRGRPPGFYFNLTGLPVWLDLSAASASTSTWRLSSGPTSTGLRVSTLRIKDESSAA
jgi:hypothetical protein